MSQGIYVGGGAVSGGDTHLDNEKEYFGTANDASVYYDGTDFIIDSAEVGSGSTRLPGNLDVEGYSSFGNANALSQDITLYLGRNFEVDSFCGEQLYVAGEIEVPLENNSAQAAVWIAPTIKLTTTGTTPWVAAEYIAALIITQPGSGTVTWSANLFIDTAPTQGTNNYSLRCAGDVYLSSDLLLESGSNIVLESTGSKIGTATSQLLGFWNATPVAQHSATGQTIGFVAGSGTAVNDDSTFTGNVGSTAYRINDIVTALKNSGIMAA